MINTVHGGVCTGNIDTCSLYIIPKTFKMVGFSVFYCKVPQLSPTQLHNIVVSGRIENALNREPAKNVLADFAR